MSTDETNGLDKLVAVKSARKAAELNDEIEREQRAKLHEFAARRTLRGLHHTTQVSPASFRYVSALRTFTIDG
jgi:hypothetical protein